MCEMIVSINSRDLPYTIDTYGMFTGDGTAEGEVSHLDEEYPELEKDYPDLEIGFDYDFPRIVEALAGWSIAFIEQAAHNEKWLKSVPIIKKSNSPRFYNYTTDSYTAEWDIDEAYLDEVTPGNWLKFAKEDGWGDYELFEAAGAAENRIVAKISLRLKELLSVDEYNSMMWEHEDECYYEHMKLDEETQKAIDEIEEKRGNG